MFSGFLITITMFSNLTRKIIKSTKHRWVYLISAKSFLTCRITVKNKSRNQMYVISKAHLNAVTLPYRAGYKLGDFIPPPVVKRMAEESKLRYKIVDIENQMFSVEELSPLIAHQLKDDVFHEAVAFESDINNKSSGSHDTGLDLLALSNQVTDVKNELNLRKKETFSELIKIGQQNMDSRYENEKTSTVFNTLPHNAVDWQQSKIDYFPLFYDSLMMNAILKDREPGEDIEHFASRVSGTILNENNSEIRLLTTQIKSSINDIIQEEIESQTHDHKERFIDVTMDSIMIISAVSTHSNTKTFSKLQLSARKMMDAWNYYFSDQDDEIDVANLNSRYLKTIDKSTYNKPTQNQISILTQEVSGSAMVGVIYFWKNNQNLLDIKPKHIELINKSVQSEQIKDVLAFSQQISSIVGDPLLTTRLSSRIINEIVDNTKDSHVKLGLYSLGYLPQLDDNILNSNMDKLITQYNRGTATDNINRHSMIQSLQQANIHKVSSQSKVLTFRSLANAFNEYARNSKKTYGFPIGLNVTSYDKYSIVKQYLTRYKNHSSKKVS
eukprot:223772_1